MAGDKAEEEKPLSESEISDNQTVTFNSSGVTVETNNNAVENKLPEAAEPVPVTEVEASEVIMSEPMQPTSQPLQNSVPTNNTSGYVYSDSASINNESTINSVNVSASQPVNASSFEQNAVAGAQAPLNQNYGPALADTKDVEKLFG